MKGRPSGALEKGADLIRFTANLLFRYTVRGCSRKRTLCESRLIVLSARSVSAAISAARRYGKSHSLSYFNPDGDLFKLEFIGVTDLIDLTYLNDNEVWYSMFVSRNPRGKLKPVSGFQACRKGGTVGDAGGWCRVRWSRPPTVSPFEAGN
jgi:hypothetical protein